MTFRYLNIVEQKKCEIYYIIYKYRVNWGKKSNKITNKQQQQEQEQQRKILVTIIINNE